MQQPNSVLITGASSGIGRALALGYAQPQVRLALVGRNRERLAEVAAAASAKGAEVEPVRLDVRDRTAMKDWMTTADADHPFDLVIANAGITTGLAPQALTEDPEAVRAVLATNLVGVLNSVEPLIGPMAARGRGHIAVVGSVAGLISLPYSPAYCAAKAAVHAYATALRGRLEPRGVCVSLVIPGFIKTPLNDSISTFKPLEVSDIKAAAIIKRGLARGASTIAFPWPLVAAARLAGFLPSRVVYRVLAGFHVNVPETTERWHRDTQDLV
ncbi:MAG: SDR family NAD(P)-dependent oxidoreductase [Beijerinckiaceae bacterium]